VPEAAGACVCLNEYAAMADDLAVPAAAAEALPGLARQQMCMWQLRQ